MSEYKGGSDDVEAEEAEVGLLDACNEALHSPCSPLVSGMDMLSGSEDHFINLQESGYLDLTDLAHEARSSRFLIVSR